MTGRPIRTAISWSAGKDSCLALLAARDEGLEVATFVTMLDPDGLSKSHALPRPLIQAQVRALGGRWRPIEAAPADYAKTFAATLAALPDDGHTHMVFGDIDLAAHREWLEPMCRDAGLVAVFPLWGLARTSVAERVIGRGIRARVVCINVRWLVADDCGRDYDAAFIAGLPTGVCPCGEGGEFHTFVWDAPGFDRPLAIARGVKRRVASMPPFSPTTFVFETPVLVEPDGVTDEAR